MSNSSISKRNANFLPAHIGKAFLTDLSHLVDGLAQTEGFKGEYLRSELFSKFCDPSTTSPDHRRAAAIAKWLAVEEKNLATNRRILLGGCDFSTNNRDSLGNRIVWTTSDELIRKARLIISDILGPYCFESIFRGGSHTNGASTRVRRGSKAAIEKHAGQAHVSSSSLKHWFRMAQNTILSDQNLEIQEGSVLFTVPKATDIDRVACKEPEINMFMQRQVGSFIRKRLRKIGINLNDQSINQRLAREALSLGLATIDLSSASDSISTQLVCELLDVDWFCLLNDIRVHHVLIDGERHDLSMFSSMGNGFTFELESLIFYALVRAIAWESGVKGRISVYGDDIIAPAEIGARIKRTFAWFGFTVNAKKSFWSGPFRESCGKHYHNSRDVTPFYIREPVVTKTELIRVLNRLLQWDAGDTGCLWHPDIISFHYKWSRLVPKRLHGGQDPEDIGALVTGDEPRDRLIPRASELKYDHTSALLWWLTTKGPSRANASAYGDGLECNPTKVTGYIYTRSPRWKYSTRWDPYLLLDIGPVAC